jgi:methylthioribulose-1-phosphate dehydratase
VSDEASAAAEAVIGLARRASLRGWTPATSGNFSTRVDARRVAITASGGDKGALTASDVLIVDPAAPAHPRASAEAPLHYKIYLEREDVGAVAHVHTPAATVISTVKRAAGEVRLEGLELMKAFRGVTTHEATIAVPILDNDQDMAKLAARAVPLLKGASPGFLLAGHGLYAWGQDVSEVWRHLEAFDFLFDVALRLEALSR